MKKSWDGRVAIVTGAATGIGAATAALFAERGAAVVVVDMNVDAGRETAAALQAKGAKALFVRADVSSEKDVVAMVAGALGAFGRVDALVNNAGIMRRHERIEDWPLEEFRRIIDINLTGLFITAQALAPVMAKNGGGVIVNISSLGALYPVPYSPCYAAAKAGVLALTRSLAPMLQPLKVRINAILPSLVETPMTKDSPVRASATPPGGMLRPSDIAQGILHAADDDSLNAAFLLVDNTLKGPRVYRVGDPPPQVELPEQPAFDPR